jgi:hypothetical protein
LRIGPGRIDFLGPRLDAPREDEAKRVKLTLEHDPEKWKPVFRRDKREVFARRAQRRDETMIRLNLIGS